ncbi:flavin reductase family protein [Rhodococcus olei]|uniref:Flavin reductase family protein n=1 Tax=Rhodococcus olei TaxID=2161675 RepID=A0ABP8P8V3_9NOCA
MTIATTTKFDPHPPALPLEPVRPDGLRGLYASVPSGVAAVCALVDGRPDGMAASSLVPVSLDPPLVSFCVQNDSRTWPRVRAADRIGVSVLAGDQRDACTALAAREGDRFADLDWQAHDGGGVFVTGASAHLECVLEAELAGGDHRIVLLRVLAGARGAASPIIFHNSGFGSIAESVSP